MRIIDEWSEISLNGETRFRVMEAADGSRSLEIKGAYEDDFRPRSGRGTALAVRLMALRSELPREDTVVALRRKA